MSEGRSRGAKAARADAAEPAGAPPTGLEAQIGFQLRQAQVAIFKDLIAELHPFGLRPADFSVLVVIEATPGLKQQAVGDALAIQRPNLVAIINELEARGLVKRGAPPGDRRAYALALTAEGEKMLAKAKLAHVRHLERVDAALVGLDKAGVREALAGLSRMGGDRRKQAVSTR